MTSKQFCSSSPTHHHPESVLSRHAQTLPWLTQDQRRQRQHCSPPPPSRTHWAVPLPAKVQFLFQCLMANGIEGNLKEISLQRGSHRHFYLLKMNEQYNKGKKCLNC